jgi:hypothetical protein
LSDTNPNPCDLSSTSYLFHVKQVSLGEINTRRER